MSVVGASQRKQLDGLSSGSRDGMNQISKGLYGDPGGLCEQRL
jgi:hypothetical protein